MEFQENRPYGNPGRDVKFLCSANKVPFIINVHGSVRSKNILIYIQQDAALHSLFYLETALHVWGGTSTHHQERKQLSTATCRYRGR